jgi:hypothetical protein
MKKIDPAYLVQYVMLKTDPDGRVKCVYRSNLSNPRALWGKTVPSISVNGTRYLIFANYIAEVAVHLEFLQATAHIPGETPINAEELRNSHWCVTPALVSNCAWVQSHLEKPAGANEQANMRAVRDLCIRERFNAAKTRQPDKTDAELVCDIAELFKVGTQLVRSAVGVRKTRGSSELHKSPMGDLKTDPRYAVLKKMVSNTRVKAYSLGMKPSFTTRSLLVRRNGVYYLPDVCPVLGVPLKYDNTKHQTYTRNPYAVRVWRKSNVYRFDDMSTTVMSAMAMHMIEGTDKNDAVKQLLVAEHPGALDRYAEWAGRYGV